MTDPQPLWNDTDKATFTQTLRDALKSVPGITLSDVQVNQCLHFTVSVVETNRTLNLTRITTPVEMAVKHFADSLTVLSACPDLPENARLIDVGTGAGFPGIVLKIVRPDISLTLLDSLNKRLVFLAQLSDALGLQNVSLLHARAEEAGRDPKHRERYDLVTARAVAALPTLLEWCAPLVRVRGRFVAMKSESAGEELIAGAEAMKALNVRLERDVAFSLPATSEEEEVAHRRVLVFAKTAPTPARYPRLSAQIKAKPLGL